MLRHKYISLITLLLLPLFLYWQMPWWAYVLLFLIHTGFTAWGAFDIRMNYFLPAFSSFKTNENAIALTFDDGPTEFTPLVLDLLAKYDAKATFFCIGKQIALYPEIAKRIVAEGHQIANHTYSHSNQMGFFSKKRLLDEFEQTDALLEKITGESNRFFRPPFGVTNPHIAKAVKEKNYKVIGWNIRSLDTVIEEEKIYNRIVDKIDKGSIVLLHDTSQKTVNVLARLLLLLRKNKYKTITVEEFEKK
ncbi:polysaccharide deacetylase family protein [Flavobacterium columnare]|uniref:Polysaccharide deacetylase family protein n=1 Tax=Flavobacterium columnare TaxID=996 RepID=A0A437UCZ8_9FLAO|nr:polysaccharide deacetylase family protein [Flavobacterium columnare]RVU91493.1 polysaccharide deacetylase family protein [Flavobacterium columnare]